MNPHMLLQLMHAAAVGISCKRSRSCSTRAVPDAAQMPHPQLLPPSATPLLTCPSHL
jgi:hypothetical protein